jgi:hypothetical protein
MEKVIASWVNGDERKKYDSLYRLTMENDFVGFSTLGGGRYIIITSGGLRETAVRPDGTWTHTENQRHEKGDYFIFDSARELYDWMIEK